MSKANRQRHEKNRLHRNDPRAVSGEDPQARQNRLHLFSENTDLILRSYQQSIAKGMVDPVVVCGDGADQGMASLAGAMGMDRGELTRQVEAHGRKQQTFTIHASMDREMARRILSVMTPSGKQFVESIPDGHFGWVVIQSGGNLYGTMTKP
jgi:hypothetical protein